MTDQSPPTDFADALREYRDSLNTLPDTQLAIIAANNLHAWLTQAAGVMFALEELDKRKPLPQPLKSLLMLQQQFHKPVPMAFAAPGHTFEQHTLMQALVDMAQGKQHSPAPEQAKAPIERRVEQQPKSTSKVVSLFGSNNTTKH